MSGCLFRLQVSHGWYTQGIIPGLTLKADPQTLALMQRFGLRLHKKAGEFALYANHYANPASDAATLLNTLITITDDAPLHFSLTEDHTHLAAITDLPDNLRGIPNFSSRQCSSDEAPEPNTKRLLPQTDPASSFGNVWLYPSDLASALPASLWRIYFSPRLFPWAYYIVNHSQLQLEQPMIRQRNGSFLQGPESIILPDGTPAIRFHSAEDCFPFLQDPQTRFGLYDRIHSPLSEQLTEICLISHLPTPGPTALEWIGEDDKRRIYAVVYVYL